MTICYCRNIYQIQGMKHKDIICHIDVLKAEELSKEDFFLVEESKKATENSYSPYSQFAVGAALRLTDGTVFTGANQENVSYPCGLCAERSALFYAMAQKPKVAVSTLAISAKNNEGFLSHPISPCGLCRQALLEYEKKFGQKITVYLNGTQGIYRVESIESLLPIQFDSLE